MLKGQDFVGIAVVYFCHDGKDKFLMHKRSGEARDEHGRWDIGAGALEFGETVEETLKREIKEEYSTEVLDFEFLGFRDLQRKYKGKPTHWVTLDFKVLINPKQVKNGEPHKFSDLGWFTVDRLPSPTHSQIPVFFEKYKSKL